jgi:hypothetical protein
LNRIEWKFLGRRKKAAQLRATRWAEVRTARIVIVVQATSDMVLQTTARRRDVARRKEILEVVICKGIVHERYGHPPRCDGIISSTWRCGVRYIKGLPVPEVKGEKGAGTEVLAVLLHETIPLKASRPECGDCVSRDSVRLTNADGSRSGIGRSQKEVSWI